MNDSRRDFLKKAALLAGATSLANILPPSIQKALAINAPEGSTYLDAEHIVILMQENRSFDHTFGTLRGVRGYNDPRAIDLPNKNKVWLQSNAKGETYAPFHLDIKNTKATWMNSLPHSWSNQTNARNDGRYDGWLESKRSGTKEYADMPLTMGYHTRADIPFYYSLADAFTVCDQNFCSSLTGTNPNRLHFWSGTVRAEQNESSRAMVWNDDMDYGTLNWTTYPERLEQNGISWKCYQNEVAIDTGFDEEGDFWLSNFQDNPLEFFGQYNIKLYKRHVEQLEKRSKELPGQISDLQNKIAALPAGDANAAHMKKQLKQMQADLESINKDREKYHAADFDALSDYQKNLHKKAFDTNTGDPHYRELEELTYDDNGTKRTLRIPKGDVLYNFRQDVMNGKLPMVSWVTAPESFSDHPSSPWFGAWYVSEVLDILTQNPEVWKKTIFILAYDENDGYFDHVPPFTAPHSHKEGWGKISAGIDTRVDFITLAQEEARHDFPEKYDREGSIGLGFRVPLVIASPWTKGGWVNSEVFDHTSTLQFLETFLEKKTGKKIVETNISPWRRMVCGDLTSVFRPYHSDPIPSPEFVHKDAFIESIYNAKFKKLPDDFNRMDAAQIKQFNADPQAHLVQQEKGIKPSCTLPYDIHVDGKLSKDKKSFEIAFNNSNAVFGSKTAGAPFNVYAPGNVRQLDGSMAPLRAWAYAVKPGDMVSDAWHLGDFEKSHYHLRVYGPNGFYREFKGNSQDPEVEIVFEPQKDASGKKLTGNALVKITNYSRQQQQLSLVDNAYNSGKQLKSTGAGKTATVTLDLSKNHNWYDVSINVQGHDSFAKRFAGRIETGMATFSDPFMGRVV
ncbi:MAG: phospholipase C, phosphocholine-specific [Bacteroidetes bacterium]|nr:phospholipase C, phosphocholine-specific [Bacteroidota bacterium]